MSGIFGFHLKAPVSSRGCLEALSQWNRIYGREAGDQFRQGQLGFGCHQEHLSDRFPGSAPVLRQENCIALIDALLYNREELLQELPGSDASLSDEELLLMFVQWQGYDALARVNGDFAGAVYDTDKKEWVFFRDHSGVRPLFYYRDDARFAFSTDLRGLTAMPGTDTAINESRLWLRLTGHNDLTLCETEYARIHCFRPAAWTVVQETEAGFCMREHIYWTWQQKKVKLPSDEAYQKELRRLIEDSVRRRLEAFPGPVGCELSGGLDSSVIAILINRMGRQGSYYSWSYSTDEIPMQQRDERKIIEDICRQENIRCQYAVLSQSGDYGLDSGEIIPPYLNTTVITKGSRQMARDGARVVFTGHGGDEGVSHRSNLYELWYHREYFAFLRNIYRGTRGKKLRLLRSAKRTAVQIFLRNRHFRHPFESTLHNIRHLLNPEFDRRMAETTRLPLLHFAFDPRAYILQGGHRVRLDNVAVQGAQAGVRYLIPFVDYRVLDYALSIPRAQFQNGYTNRYVYRAAFDDIIPQSLRDMHYKDTPSMQNFTPRMDIRADFEATKAKILAGLDEAYWKDYLLLDSIRDLQLPENAAWEDYVDASDILNELATCCLIQRAAEKPNLGSNDHDQQPSL